MSGADEVMRLGDDLKRSAGEVVGAVRDAMDEAGRNVRDGWREGVRAKAPRHLPHLPAAITHQTRYTFGGVAVEIGPESGKKQGRLGRGEELGSVNQPPHLSGLTAHTAEEPRLERDVADRLGRIIP